MGFKRIKIIQTCFRDGSIFVLFNYYLFYFIVCLLFFCVCVFFFFFCFFVCFFFFVFFLCVCFLLLFFCCWFFFVLFFVVVVFCFLSICILLLCFTDEVKMQCMYPNHRGTNIHSITSMTRMPMARKPWLIRTRFESLGNYYDSPK